MSHFQNTRVPVLVAALAALLIAVIPGPAEAQRRVAVARSGVHYPVYGPAYRAPVHYYPYRYAYPYYWRSAWWFSFGFSYPWGYPYGYVSFGYPYYGYGYPYAYPYPGYAYPIDLTTSIRIEVPQRDAEVFVDGYSAGRVDDFDGTFQRLRLRPGGHEIAIYLDGYRTFRQDLYVRAGASQTIRHELERLGPGEAMEPRPSPDDARSSPPASPGQPGTYDEPRPNGPVVERVPRGEAPSRFGTLAIRVQPADAEVLVDGERWSAPADASRLAIELSPGRHTVEVRKNGFAVYREDVLIRPGTTTSLNVSLTR